MKSFTRRATTAFDIASKALVTVAAGALLWTIYEVRTAPPDPPIAPRIQDVAGLRIDASRATKRVGTSPVVLVEFTDFQCPFCARHANDTYPSIRRDFVDQKKLTYVSLAFPIERIHPHARKASEAAECAARQGRYWEMHERLFSNQAALSEPDVFMKSATAIGLDTSRFERCMASEAASAVAADLAEALRLKVNSTPTFFLGRIQSGGGIELVKRINGAAPFEVIAAEIENVTKAG